MNIIYFYLERGWLIIKNKLDRILFSNLRLRKEVFLC